MFSSILPHIQPLALLRETENADTKDIRSSFYKEKQTLNDLALMLHPKAQDLIEEMAQIAHDKTVKRFGYSVSLFTPLYLSNDCVNSCAYCSFNMKLNIQIKTLSLAEIDNECSEIKKQGFDHILLVSSENPKIIHTHYLIEAVKIAKKYFHNVAVEVYSLSLEQYQALKNEANLDGVTLFQETYNKSMYEKYHPAGPKKNFEKRIDTMDLVAQAGIKKINLGCLLGLNDFREDILYMASHLDYLKKSYWQCDFGISFPRIRKNAGNFDPPFPVSDIEFVQMILALRIYDDNVSLTLSTRENESFRNHLIPLGITSMSAGAKTNPGGYTGTSSESQFKISDERTPQEISKYLESIGYESVWKDWERAI